MSEKTRGPQPVGEMQGDGSWSKTVWVPNIPDHYFADEDGLSKELAIERHAADDAGNMKPSPEATTLSPTEEKICARIFEGILLLNEFLASELSKAVDTARRRDVPLSTAKKIEDQLDGAVDRALGSNLTELKRLKKQELKAERDLKRFRHDNKLHRGAHYHDSLAMTWTIVLAMLVVESLANGVLFSKVVSNGLFGGAILAAMISILNIVLGLTAGVWGWRNLGHVNARNKGLGTVAVLVCHGAAIVWNLLVAHFREAAEILVGQGDFAFEPAQLSAATMGHIETNGLFGLGSLEALALLLLGLGIHFYAAKKGWDDFADRYPDYKKFDRIAEERAEAHEEAAEHVRTEAREEIERIESRVAYEAEGALVNQRNIDALIDLAHERHQEVQNSEDDWVLTGSTLLKIYRSTNAHLRDHGTAPTYFDVYPTAENYRERTFGGGVRRDAKIETQESIVKKHLDTLTALRDTAAKRVEIAEALKQSAQTKGTLCIKALNESLDQAIDAHEKAAKIAIVNDDKGFDDPAPATRVSRKAADALEA